MSSTKKGRNIRSISGKVFRSGGGGSRVGAGAFAQSISAALRREYGGTHSSVKTVVGLTGANERGVKNWFDAKNGPSGELLIALCHHSDEVLEAFLILCGREALVTAKKLVDAKRKLHEMLALIDELEGG